ncbi:MAG: cytochrome c [Thermoanaerobaculia bacterium]|nr:cytochrome c [Thermoanaerobaculia bacterium]
MSPGKTKTDSRPRATLLLGVAVAASLALAGCRLPQKMAEQPQFDPLEKSAFFPDGASSRPLVDGTVVSPRVEGTLAQIGSGPNELFDTGREGGQFSDNFPLPLTPELMARGKERFEIYCTPCHGRVGEGNGMIVARGYKRPPSYHSDALRSRKNGYIFDVITNGFGVMPAYRSQVPPADRWAIVAYVRALQVSQNATIADVPSADRASLDGTAPAPKAEGEKH